MSGVAQLVARIVRDDEVASSKSSHPAPIGSRAQPHGDALHAHFLRERNRLPQPPHDRTPAVLASSNTPLDNRVPLCFSSFIPNSEQPIATLMMTLTQNPSSHAKCFHAEGSVYE